jgi:phage-related protein
MIKLVRVVLSATVDPFVGEIRRALGAFSGFASGIASGVRSVVGFLGDIGNIVSGVKHGFDMLAGTAHALWDTFIQGAIDEERLGLTMKYLSGSAENANKIMEGLDDWTVRTGTDSAEAEEAILDMAKALRATDGAVNPDKLFQTMDLLKRLSIVSGLSIAEMSKVVGRAMTGDVEMLARTLGISKEQLAKLSPEFAKFMQNAQGAQETQLNEVMRLGGDAQQASGDALKALDEITTALGAGQDAISEYASTAGGEVLSLQALWDNFTEDVGKELLPIIQTALEKLLTFIAEHKEDIDKFVKAFGELSAEGFEKLMDLIDSGKLEQFAQSLGTVSDAGESLKQAFEWLSKAAQDIETIMNSFNGLYEKITGGPAPGNFDPLAVNPNAPLQKILNGETPTIGPNPETMPDWMKSIGELLGAKQEVEIKVSVDDDMKLKAIYDKSTDDKIGELVENITGSKKKAPQGH